VGHSQSHSVDGVPFALPTPFGTKLNFISFFKLFDYSRRFLIILNFECCCCCCCWLLLFRDE
jgi:hypothetical protein